MKFLSWWWSVTSPLLLECIVTVVCHGRLLEPPSRASMWRQGFPSPKDYNDNQMSCGGRQIQWEQNGGKCGICGDRWDFRVPRDHEAGGKYATGIIVRNYTQGQIINIQVEITASHRGYFQFRLCPKNDFDATVTQACFDQHVLQQADGSERTMETGVKGGEYLLEYKLPENIACEHCLFQWKWNTGNTWGCDLKNKTNCCLGCGPQEQFYACADVSISPSPQSSETGGSHNNEVDSISGCQKTCEIWLCIHAILLFCVVFKNKMF